MAGKMPREIAPGVFWIGDCLAQRHKCKTYHGYNAAYLIAGETASCLVETGHPKDFPVIERHMGDCGIGDQSGKFRPIHPRADGSDIPELAGDLASQRGKPPSDCRFAARNDLDDHRQAIFGIAGRLLEGVIELVISVRGRRLCGHNRRHQHRRRDDRDRPFT